jgi:peptidoglycan/LPS O-acetylase OafA/YrhL
MKKKYIDSIRGIAILMVIFVHTSLAIKNLGFCEKILSMYGQMGVQLFFVASAYTLCLSASNRTDETYKLRKYAIRRYFRIAPAYYLAIFFYFIISSAKIYFKTGEIMISSQYNLVNVLSNITFVHGFYSPANNNIVPGGWSIGTEMAFYVIFPLLYSFSLKQKLSIPKNFMIFIFSSFLI